MRKILWAALFLALLLCAAFIFLPPGPGRQPQRPAHVEVDPEENGYTSFLRASLSNAVPVVADPAHPTAAEAATLAGLTGPFSEMLEAARRPEFQRYEKLPKIDPNQPNYIYPTEKKLVRAALARATALPPRAAQEMRMAAYLLATRLAEEHAPFAAAIASADLRSLVRSHWAEHPVPVADALHLVGLEAGLPSPADFLRWEVGASERGHLEARQGGPLESYPGLEGRAQDALVGLLDQQLAFLPAFEKLDVGLAHTVQQGFQYRKGSPSDHLIALPTAIPNYERLLAILRADRRDGLLLACEAMCRLYYARQKRKPATLEEALAPHALPMTPLTLKLDGDQLTVADRTVVVGW